MQWQKQTEAQLENLTGDIKTNKVYFKLVQSYKGEPWARDKAWGVLVNELKNKYGGAEKVVCTNDNGKEVWLFEVDSDTVAYKGETVKTNPNILALINKVAKIYEDCKTYYPSIRVKNEYRNDLTSQALERKSERKSKKKGTKVEYALDRLQLDAINQLLSQKEMILALGTGLGKTVISLVSAREAIFKAGRQILDTKKNHRILVVALKSNIEQLKSVIRDEELGACTDVINYEAFNNLIKFGKTKDNKKNRRKPILNPKSKYKYLLINKYDVIILDEIHKVKNPHSDVGNALKHFLLMNPIEWRWGMSATPFSNSEQDLLGIMANATNHPIGQLTTSDLELLLKYEEEVTQEDGTKIKVPKGLETFKKLAVEKSIWYRRGADYGIKFSNLVPEFIKIEPDDWYIDEYRKIIEKARKMTIVTSNRELVINTADMAIAKLSLVYKKSWVKNKIEQLNNQGHQVLVMASLNEVFLNPLAQELGLEAYTGQTALKQRERMREDFVAGNTKVILGNYGAISTGVDGLDESCNHLILAQPVWSIGLLTQAIGRIRRRNPEFEDAFFYVPYVVDTPECVSVEAKMVSRLEKKLDKFDYFLEHEDSQTSNELTQAFKSGMLNTKAELYKQIYNN